MTEMEKEALEIRVVLKGPLVDRFERIQRWTGIESRADVLRYIINRYYEEVESGRAP